MKEVYKRACGVEIVKDGGRFGIFRGEEELLGCEYDSIFEAGGGFIITKDSRSGFVKFEEKPSEDGTRREWRECVRVPCVYDRIEPRRNGLVLISMTPDPYLGERRTWLDYHSGRIHENLHFLRNHGVFDEFLDNDAGAQMPHLRRAEDGFCVSVPFGLCVHILYRLPLGDTLAQYFVCAEELSESEAKRKGYGYEYLFTVVLKSTYTFTEGRKSQLELFENLSHTVEYWEREAKRELEMETYIKESKKEI